MIWDMVTSVPMEPQKLKHQILMPWRMKEFVLPMGMQVQQLVPRADTPY